MSDFRHLWGSLTCRIFADYCWAYFRPLQTIPNRSDLTIPKNPCDFFCPRGGRGREKVKIIDTRLHSSWARYLSLIKTGGISYCQHVISVKSWSKLNFPISWIHWPSFFICSKNQDNLCGVSFNLALHKHNLASNFLLSLSCFRNTKWKCLVTRSPTQTGSMAMPVTKRWEKSSDQPQNILALEIDILSSCLLQMWN